jgi:hypothetical protein
MRSSRLACAAIVAAFSPAAACAAPAARAGFPDPCGLVPAPSIAAAVGAHAAAAPSAAATSRASTCSYGGLLTIEIGVTALTNPAPILKSTKLTAVPHGVYTTYAGSKQTQIVFYEGTAASGTYVVVRAFTGVKQKQLVRIAHLAHASLTNG